MNFDVREIRKDFPILEQTVNNRRLVYFDNAATTQKPRRVIDKIVEVYTQYNANVHRGVHHLSNLATTATLSRGNCLKTSIKQKLLNGPSTTVANLIWPNSKS